MLTLYYRIWVDLIKKINDNPNKETNWKSRAILLMTMAMSANLILIMTFLEKKIFKSYFYKIDLSVLPTRLNNVISYIFLFILPCFVINYILIFRKSRYLQFLHKYPSHGGKLAGMYMVVSIMLPVALLLLGILSGKLSVNWGKYIFLHYL